MDWDIANQTLRRNLGLSCLGALAAIILWMGVSASLIYDFQDTIDPKADALPPVDAIVCLAGARGRIQLAAELWKSYKDQAKDVTPTTPTPILYLSGLGPHVELPSLHQQISPALLAELKPVDVVTESESQNTVENIEYLLKTAVDRKWSRFVLVTSNYHMKRSKEIVEQMFKNKIPGVEIYTLSLQQEPLVPGLWPQDGYAFRVTLLEYFKWVFLRDFGTRS